MKVFLVFVLALLLSFNIYAAEVEFKDFSLSAEEEALLSEIFEARLQSKGFSLESFSKIWFVSRDTTYLGADARKISLIALLGSGKLFTGRSVMYSVYVQDFDDVLYVMNSAFDEAFDKSVE